MCAPIEQCSGAGRDLSRVHRRPRSTGVEFEFSNGRRELRTTYGTETIAPSAEYTALVLLRASTARCHSQSCYICLPRKVRCTKAGLKLKCCHVAQDTVQAFRHSQSQFRLGGCHPATKRGCRGPESLRLGHGSASSSWSWKRDQGAAVWSRYRTWIQKSRLNC